MAAVGDKPSSTRKDKKGKRELPSKAANLEKELKRVRLKLVDREKQLKSAEGDNKLMKQKIDGLELWKRKQQSKMANEQKLRTGAMSERLEMQAFLEKTQRAIGARLKILGIDFTKCNDIREALDAALRAINDLVTSIEERDVTINELTEENELLQNKMTKYESKINELKQQLIEQSEQIDSQTIVIKQQTESIDTLETENGEQKAEIERLLALLAELREDYASLKADSSHKIEQMTGELAELGDDNASKTTEIEELMKLVSELRGEIESLKATLAERDDTVVELNKLLSERTKTLTDNTLELEKLRKRVAELEAQLYDITHVPTEEKGCNTLLTGDINHQLSDYPRLLKSIVELRNIVEAKNALIAKLQQENRELILEMQILLKKLVKFNPCSTNHISLVLCLAASPNSYLFATGSNDGTVRLWKVDPDSTKNKGKNKIMVLKRSNIEGKVDCVGWNHDGSMLACGSAYTDSPDGYVVIWSMVGDNKYDAMYAIRSRPTVRFGRVKALAFSNDDQYIYCGDITGSVWVFDLHKELKIPGSGLIGVVQSHNDVIHDLAISTANTFLFTVCLDQSLAVFELPKSFGGLKTNAKEAVSVLERMESKRTLKKQKTKKALTASRKGKSRRNVGGNTPTTPSKHGGKTPTLDIPDASHGQENSAALKYSLAEILEDESKEKIKHFAGFVIATDSKYPFWKVCVSDNGETVICASRKVKIFNIKDDNPSNKDNLIDGAKIQDSDLDHVKSLRLRDGKLLLARCRTNRAKLFDINDGKEIKKFPTKKPVVASDFLGDNAHIVLCCQEEPGDAKHPPAMKLVKYSNERREITKVKDESVLVLSMGGNTTDGGNEDSKDDSDSGNGGGGDRKSSRKSTGKSLKPEKSDKTKKKGKNVKKKDAPASPVAAPASPVAAPVSPVADNDDIDVDNDNDVAVGTEMMDDEKTNE